MINNEADWILVEQARHGNEEALLELIRRYEPLVLSIQNRYYLQELETADWEQESKIVLWEVILRFDVSRTHAFGSYLKTALINRRHDHARRLNAKKRKANGPMTSIDAHPTFFAETLADKQLFSSDHLIIFRQRLVDIVKKEMSKMERAVLIALVSGDTEEAICNRFGLDHTQFHNANERIKRKIKRHLQVE
ncbi:sigma factor [Secundilactobacillus silagei]|uniref:DNA-directed RNA polymerase specialized sigma subunit n=1 Tax=Secundilactobacillus silagei JCM 19001 TaxID=1302250 RepID=A0A1Z5IGT2_9LACO|nr:sigma factor [Secundilactobacillus silagei]TDG69166.1 hypothetical protein C5L25_000097 [Secundilactobacillus silagei JCM 19001]GAX00889.1 DNA-directed RNA polymerase specialized sigma subunit [Secundilactobacillus silagei JCM 19001]